MRALIAARKSNKVDGKEGHSLETQDQRAREFCERMGWEIVGVARDTISGRIAPVDRRELGAWLAQPHTFDAIVAYKTDRLSRGEQEDWTRIEHWATEQRKQLIIVDGATGIRYPARDDSDYWQWQATKREAGREWESARERIVRAHQSLEATGSFIGRPPFGYNVEGDKYAKRLVVEENLRTIVITAFDMAIAGKSLTQIALWLDSVTDLKWHETKVRRLIHCWTYAGRLERGGRHYADCPAIIEPGTLVTAQKTVASRARKSTGGRPSANPPLMVMKCGGCDIGRLYLSNRHYRCRGNPSDAGLGCGLSVPRSVESKVIALVTSSTEPEMRSEIIKGSNWADEIETAKRDQRQALERKDITTVIQLHAQIEELESRDIEPDRIHLVPTGRTVGEAYATMDREELRSALKAWTITAYPEPGIATRKSRDGKLIIKSPWDSP